MARPTASAEAVLSAVEAIDIIRNLSVPDLLRLKRASQYLSYGGARPPAVLRNEAIRRVADGRRKCPRDIPIVTILYGVMRSIASADRKALQRTPTLAVVPRHDSAATSPLDGVDPRLSPEERLIQEQENAEIRRRILDLFEDDVVAQTLAEGIIDGMEGKELRGLVELNDTEFATKRRLIRRRIDKAFPDGWKP